MPDKTVTHHTVTERVERVAEQVLSGERSITPGVRDLSLTPIEQLRFDELAAMLRAGDISVDEELWRLDYLKKPPDIEQFILDDYYLGKSWRPIQGENEGIWPAWLDSLSTHMNINSRIHNMVITGSLGVGKTSIMVLLILYRMCIATHLKNPQNFFGLSRNSNLVYNLLSVTKEAVKETAFGSAMTYMGDSPYFVEVCRYNPDLDYSNYRIPMQNPLPDGRISSIWLTAGSKGHHVLGRNLIGSGLDEGQLRLEKDPDLKAYQLYDQVRTRIANRFQKIAGYLPALCVIASSAQDESSFTEKVVAEIEESNRLREIANRQLPPSTQPDPPTQIVFRNSVYKIKRHALTGITKDHHWFKVAYGLKNMEPYILSGWYREDGTPILDEPHEEPPTGAKTELVPKFYIEAYRRNCKAQLQNLSGISVGGSHRLFSSIIDIEHCLAISKQEGVPDPLIPGIQRMPISSEDSKNIWDYLNHKTFLTRVSSRIQAIRHPQHMRYAHIDLATQSLAGVSICHLAGSQLVEGLVKNGEPFAEYRLIVEYDFILTICSGQNKPINFGKIQKFFFWLRDMCGYQFGLITADTWQSEAPLQELEARQFNVDKLSIDRDKSVYTAWRAGFEEHRVRLHRNEQMIREAEQLLEMDKKFDHPPDGCFTGDTRVALLDGTLPTFEELATRYPNGEKFPVFSMSKTGICFGWAHSPRITRKDAPLVEIILDNFQVIRCTPNHLFMTLAGGWIEAKDLTSGTSIMPLYRNRELKGGWRGYERVWCPVRNQRFPVHQLVARQLFGNLKNRIVHHEDEVKYNNHPGNLKPKTKAQHAREHTRKRHQTDFVWVQKLRDAHAVYRNNGGNEKSRETILKLYEIGKLRRKPGRTSGQTNHTILALHHLEQKADVWDITVDKTHNFALACGVFVHNSKDTSDGAAGAYYNAVNSDEKISLISHNAPSVYTGQQIQQYEKEPPPIELPLPSKGYTRSKVFKV